MEKETSQTSTLSDIPRSTKWCKENPEKVKLQKAKYYKTHKTQVLAKNRIQYNKLKNHPDYIENKRKYYNKNKNSLLRKTNERRNTRRKLIVDYKGGKCEICGYEKCISVLDFHHKDATEKDFTINNVLLCKGFTLESIKEELDKCILLCSNCHRELHYNERLRK